MTEHPIYLDHNATTPILPEVVEAMLPYLHSHFGNPSSSHVYGQRARAAVEEARNQVARLVSCECDEIFFTSGGTESNNLAIRGAMAACLRRGLVTSVIEHPATRAPTEWLETQGSAVIRLGATGDGRVCLPDAEAMIDASTALVTIMHSNNETGVMQPIRELARAAQRVGALIHTDAAQSAGKVEIDVNALSVDLLSLAGHKLYAPKGVGALYVRRGVRIQPLVLGAGHERGLRPGTENVAGIVGLGAACACVRQDLAIERVRVERLRNRLWSLLQASIEEIAVTGGEAERLPNTLHVRFPRVSGRLLLEATPGIAASAGSACHAGGESPSEVLLAMGIGPADALGAIRLTLGRGTTEPMVVQAAALLTKTWHALSNGP
ncbi:MAG: cysteine desulfurase family protein [Steroidobacteraceae bacterium]